MAMVAPELQDRLAQRANQVKTACENGIGDFLDSVAELDSRLNVGLVYTDYSSKVADIQVAHDKVVASSISGNCLKAAVAAENALNRYKEAATIWDNCNQDDYCVNDTITPELQAKWTKASAQDAKAKAAFAKIAAASTASLGSRTPPVSSAVIPNTIYGTIVKLVCENPDPPATAEPCTKLRNTLAGGVDKGEQGDLENEIDDLLVALGLKSG